MTTFTNGPLKIQVKKGETKFICTCLQSKNAPFCDGSHGKSGKTPLKVTFEEDKLVSFCGCGKSQKGVFCDGAHKNC